MVHLDCSKNNNKILEDNKPWKNNKTNRIYFSQLEAGKVKFRVPADLVPVEVLPSGLQRARLTTSSHGNKRTRKLCEASFIRAVIPFMT